VAQIAAAKAHCEMVLLQVGAACCGSVCCGEASMSHQVVVLPSQFALL
jgi:hypothetical protein